MLANINTRIVARNLGVPEAVVIQIIDEYVKTSLLQMVFSGSSETPFGVMTLRKNHIYIDVPSTIINDLINREPGDEDVRDFIADKIESGR